MKTDNEERKMTATVPYFVYEGELARAERMRTRMYVLCVLLIIAFVSTNVLWLLHIARLGK